VETSEISGYIRNIKKSLSNRIPKENIEKAMVDISNYFLSNWVVNNDFLLDNSDIERLVNKYVSD
jgi:hypothetical protein